MARWRKGEEKETNRNSGGRNDTGSFAFIAMRVIAGTAGGIQLTVPRSGVRPTMDRVKAAIFSSLGEAVIGARVLDLFAGSGALGLEALSRGAARVEFIERDVAAARALGVLLQDWQARDAQVVRADALDYLGGAVHPLDIVFLDPPFAAPLLQQAAALLEQRHWLKAGALIYVECAAREGLPPLPPTWQPLKAKQAGEVGYHLFMREAPDSHAA